MVRIKVRDTDDELNGKVLEAVHIDEAGDAELNATDAERYGTRWIFKPYFDVINEDEVYKIIISVKNLLELHSVLDQLPQHVIESATLETI